MVFLSKYDRYTLLIGYAEGRPVFAEFVKGRFETDDPVFIEALLRAHDEKPHDIWPEQGAFVCPECHKPFKTQFALDGHMRSHKKADPEPEATSVSEE